MSPHIPQARVVRKAGIAFAPPPVPLRERLAALEEGLGPRVRGFASAIIGLWPVTAVLVLMVGLAWIAAMQGSP
jgi:hypothetical protein